MSRPEGGSRGPIRRFPPGFWLEFNQWWHAEYARVGHRPSSKNIARWHAENAFSVWGRDNIVSYAETQRHANRMKCRRSTMNGTSSHGDRNRSWDEEEDDDEEEEDEDRDEDAGDEQRHNKARVSSSAVGLDLNPHSDVPGALLGGAAALNADSDVPEPAAERASKRRHTARAASRTLPCTSSADNKPTYLQPDPTGPRTCTGDVGMNWDSGITVRSGPEAGVEHAASFLHNAIPSTNSTALPNACKQLGNPAAVDPASAFESAAICHADKKPRLSAPVPAASPFADMAATAAACAGLPSAASLPAARDAAALLACAGRNDTSGQQHPAPAWLTSAGLELRRLMHELGIASAAPLAVTARPSRALSSREPLCLPPPRVHRDLDGLLLRGASNGRGSSGCGGGLQLPQHSAAGPHRTSSSMGLSGTPQLGGGAGARGGERTGVALGYALHAAGAPGVSGVQGGVLRQQQQQQQPQQRDSSWRSGNRGGVVKGLMGSDMAEYYMQDLL